MKLLFISLMEGFPWGGSEELWCKVAGVALDQKDEVYVSVKKWDTLPPKLQKLAIQGARITTRDTSIKSVGIIARVVRKLFVTKNKNKWDFIASIEPDIICINMGGAYDIAYNTELLKMIEKINKPYYLIQQFNQENIVLQQDTRMTAKKAFENAQAVFFVSERNKNTTQRNLVIKLHNAAVISNPVVLKNNEQLPFPVTNERIYLASVARLDAAYKGQDLLLEVLSIEKWKSRNWQLNIFGDGPDKKYLEELVIFLGLGDKVFFRGKTDDIQLVWEKNHLLIMPSIAEGTPLALIEAMVCGRPAVVTNVGGNTDLIEDHITGFIAQAPTILLLDEALEKAWENKNNWNIMGEAAHKKITANFDINSYKKVYSKLISK